MDPWLALLYDYVVVGEVDLPDGVPAVVASVHTVASTATDFLHRSDAESDMAEAADFDRIAQPGDEAWVPDIAFEALRRNADGHRFIIGGDWNTSRLFDAKDRDGKITNTLFFSRAAKARTGGNAPPTPMGNAPSGGPGPARTSSTTCSATPPRALP